jgi:hypothetical protein
MMMDLKDFYFNIGGAKPGGAARALEAEKILASWRIAASWLSLVCDTEEAGDG